MTQIVFDTTVLIDHLRGHSPALQLIKKVESGEIAGSISAITVAELFAGGDSGVEKRRELINRLVSLFEIVPLDRTVGENAGAIKRESGCSLVDSMIAATAIMLNSRLLTSNIRDFDCIKGLELKKPY